MKFLKNIFEDNSLIFTYIPSAYPAPCHAELVDRVLELAESKGMQAKIFVESSDKFSSVTWFEKMFPNIMFEETKLHSTVDILENIRPYYSNVIVVDKPATALLFESVPFVAFDYEAPKGHILYRKFQEEYEGYLLEKDSRKLFSLLNPPKQYAELSQQIDETRENYFQGNIYKVGSTVTNSGSKFEVLSRGNNYVIVANESGEVSKKFINTLSESVEPIQFNTGIFKGFMPSDAFLQNEIVMEAFSKTIEDYEAGVIVDSYAILKSIQSVDKLLNGIDENIGNIQYSLNKIGQLEFHEYLNEMADANIQTQKQAAQIIAGAIGSSSKGTPTEIVNNAIKMALKTHNKIQIEILKKMLSTIEKVGVKYDKTLLESEDMSRIHKDFQALRGKSTKQVLQDHQDLRKIGVDYCAKDVGGKREMIKDILSHNHGPGQLKTYKSLSAKIRRNMDPENVNPGDSLSKSGRHIRVIQHKEI